MATVYDTDVLRVYTRAKWSNAWTLQVDLQPVAGSISCGNQNQSGQATFTRVYGPETKYPTETAYSARTPLYLDLHWVQMREPPYGPTDIIWQGRFFSEPRQINGNPTSLPADASGIQTFVAWDGHSILQRMEWYGSTGVAKDHATGPPPNDVVVTSDYVIKFNRLWGNRTSLKHTMPGSGLDCYVFDLDDFDGVSGERWSGEDVIEYLLGTRINSLSPDAPTWIATGTNLLSLIKDEYDLGEPSFNMLDAIKVVVNRSYAVGFVVLPTMTGFEIKVFGLLADPVTYGSVTVPANAVVRTIDANSSILDLGPVVERSFTDEYAEIVVIGSRAVICASFDRDDMTEGWSANDRAEYDEPISGVGPFSPEQLDRAREADKHRYAFSNFYIDPSTVQLPAPWFNDDGTIDTATTTLLPVIQRETLDFLPMYEGKDYTTDPPTYNSSPGWDLLPPSVWMKDSNDIYQNVYRHGVHVEGLPNMLGVRMSPPIPHYIARGDFAPAGIHAPTKVAPEFTPDGMKMTIAWEYDLRQKMKLSQPGSIRLDGRKVVFVDLPFWLIAPNTIIDVMHDGSFIQTPDSWMVVASNTEAMARAMAGAVGRYTRPRQRLTSRQQGLATRQGWLGDIIHVVNDGTDADQIKGPLTSINWKFSPGILTTLKTGYGRLNRGDLSTAVLDAVQLYQANLKVT